MTMGDMRQKIEGEALAFLFAALTERGVSYAILRNYERLPHAVGSRDIDVVVHPQDLPAATACVVDLAERLGCQFGNYFRDDMFVSIWLFRRLEDGRIFNLCVDLFPGRHVYGVQFLSADEMLADVGDHNGIPVVRDIFLFLDKWIYHQIVGQPTPEKYDVIFTRIASENREALIARLTPILGSHMAEARIDRVCAGKPSAMETLTGSQRLGLLLRAARAHGYRVISGIVKFCVHRLRDLVITRGTFVSISGPDGSGKTTVIERLITQLEQVHGPDSVIYSHFRPAMLPRIAEVAKATGAITIVDTEYNRPHRSQPSDVLGSLARVLYYGLDYVGGYVRSVYPVLLIGKIALFDRYYYDMIADPYRSSVSLPLQWMITIGKFLPLPRHAFFIRVAPQEIHRRKQELTLERIIELNDRYNELVRLGWLVAIDNDDSPDIAAAAIVDHIVAARHRRAEKSLRKCPPRL